MGVSPNQSDRFLMSLDSFRFYLLPLLLGPRLLGLGWSSTWHFFEARRPPRARSSQATELRLRAVGLEGVQHEYIGSDTNRGISGEESFRFDELSFRRGKGGISGGKASKTWCFPAMFFAFPYIRSPCPALNSPFPPDINHLWPGGNMMNDLFSVPEAHPRRRIAYVDSYEW